jgi:hypothetical protein
MQVEHLENPHKYTVYHLPRRRQAEMRRGALIGFALLGSLFIAAVSCAVSPPSAFPTMGLPLIYFGALIPLLVVLVPLLVVNVFYLWLSAASSRIVISEDSIEYHTTGYSLIVPASAIVSVAKRRRGRENIECLILNQSQFLGSHFLLWLSGNYALGNAIPIGNFDGWREDELGTALNRLAPHLFSPVSSPGLPAFTSSFVQPKLNVPSIVSTLFAPPVAGKSLAKPRPKPVVRRP